MPYLIFGALALTGGCLVLFWLPETRNTRFPNTIKDLEEGVGSSNSETGSNHSQEEELEIEIDEKAWLRCLSRKKSPTNNSKILSWVYKFYLRDTPYNVRLHKMGESPTEMCKYCY